MNTLDEIYFYYPDDGKYLEEPIVGIRPPHLVEEKDATPSVEALPILSRMPPVIPNKTHYRILPQKIIWDQEDTSYRQDTQVYPIKWNFTEDMSVKIVLLMILVLQVARFFQ